MTVIVGFVAGPRVLTFLDGLGPSASGPIAPSTQVAAASSSETPIATKPKLATTTDPYLSLSLEAKGVFVWDINAHKKLFGRNEHQVLPLASVTKMMMALVASENLSPDAKVTITPADLLEEGDTGLSVGESWKFSDLLEFTLVTSSNDGAAAIARTAGKKLFAASSTDSRDYNRAFIRRMNERAAAIGLTQTSYQSESGLDLDATRSGAYGTARDMAILFEYVLRKRPEIFTATTYAKLEIVSDSGIVHRVANTNTGAAATTGIIGSKTGYTDLAGGNLVVVVDIGIDHPVVIAVLGSSRDGRFTDVERLIEATEERIAALAGGGTLSSRGASSDRAEGVE